MTNARIDADFQEPAGGFRPVQVTYVWEEGGLEKKDVRVARTPAETYTIACESTPLMKSLVVELAKRSRPPHGRRRDAANADVSITAAVGGV